MTLKTVLTVGFGGLLVWAAFAFVAHTLLALTLTAAALMLAVALDHGVALLVRRGLPRPAAIAVVSLAALGVVVGLGFIVIPPAVGQAKTLVVRMPEILKAARATRVFHFLDDRLNIGDRLLELERELPRMLEGAAAPLLTVLGGVLTGAVAVVTVAVLTIFMLIFGGNLVQGFVGETVPEHRLLFHTVLVKTYRSIGGYLLGLGLICAVNGVLTTVFLAVVRLPFFLPLGILSGLSSLIPYAGPAVVGTTVSLIATATGGVGIGLACALYFILYGQLEGQVLAPLVFRRTVHVNPLVVVLSVLFFAELAGIVGAVLAVPVAAAIQIIVREVLRMRRETLHLPVTALNSPERTDPVPEPPPAQAPPPPPPPASPPVTSKD